MTRATAVISLVAVALAAGATYYGTMLADELREQNDVLARSQAEAAKTQLQIAEQLKALGKAQAELTRRGADAGPAVKEADPEDGAGEDELIGTFESRIANLEQGPGANSPIKDDLISRYMALTAQMKADKNMSADARTDALDAVSELAKWGDPDALAIVMNALDDENEFIREKAVAILGDMANPDHLPHLKKAMDDESLEVRGAIPGALQMMPADKAAPLLMQMLNDPHDDVVQESVESLSALGYTPARSEFVKLVDHQNLDIVCEAGAALRIMGDNERADKAVQRCAEGLGHERPEQRIEAIKRLRTLSGDKAVELLKKATTDPETTVREEAEEALHRLGYSG